MNPARETYAQTYWREIFEHWVETGQLLPAFCAEVGYSMQRTYAAFYQRFYKAFILHQHKLGVKCGRAKGAQ